MSYFFIGGPPRSGGTLLYSILCSDSLTNPLLRETHYFRHIVETYLHSKKSFASLEGNHFFTDAAELRDYSACWAIDFLERTRRRYPPAVHVALKSFMLTPLLPAVHELIPDAKFLISVRDPRDVIASMFEVAEKQQAQGKAPRFPRDPQKRCEEYLATYGPCVTTQNAAFRRKILFVKYEQLVQRPMEVLDQIRIFTGLPLDNYNPDTNWSAGERDFSKERASGDPYINDLYGKAVSSSRIGRYRYTLTQEELDIIERECRGVFSTFGYPPDDRPQAK